MKACNCTKLTGECCHDCPVCGGEGVLGPHTSRLTAEEVRALLKQGAKGVQELRDKLTPVFRLGARQRNLVLD
jgi:hypothetical protein